MPPGTPRAGAPSQQVPGMCAHSMCGLSTPQQSCTTCSLPMPQDILVFDSTSHGRVLVLDGVIQITERDECAYQEMLAHLPLMALRRPPKRVLVVGGGDGGIVREVLKHASVEEVVMCEIDEEVVAAARRWFSGSTACAMDDPRLTLRFQDAAVYMKRHRQAFDVIIVDSSDPVGPAESLFTSQFFASMRDALAPGGVIATQGEAMHLHLPLIASTLRAVSDLFPNADYAWTPVPTYPSGAIGFTLCSSDPTPDMLRQSYGGVPASLKHYTRELHRAAFVLPAEVEATLAPCRRRTGEATDRQGSGVPLPVLAVAGAAALLMAVTLRKVTQ